MSWTWYNIKELGVARVKTDAKGVIGGPEYHPIANWDGAKKLGVNLTQEQVIATGNGKPIDTQSTEGGVEVAVETNLLTPEVEAILYGQAHSETPTKTRLIYHEDSGGKFVGLWARTDKTDSNGEDVVLWIPKAQFAQMNKDIAEAAHRLLTYNGKANYTKSLISFEEINDTTGILETLNKRFLLVEDNNRIAASLFSPNTGYLTVETSSPITGHVVGDNIEIKFARSLKRASVNKSTVLFKQSSTPVAFALSLEEDDLVDDTIVINPNSALTAATTYTVTLKETIQDTDGNLLEQDTVISVTTAS